MYVTRTVFATKKGWLHFVILHTCPILWCKWKISIACGSFRMLTLVWCLCGIHRKLMEVEDQSRPATVSNLQQRQKAVEQQATQIQASLDHTSAHYQSSWCRTLVQLLVVLLIVGVLVHWCVGTSYEWLLQLKALPFTKPLWYPLHSVICDKATPELPIVYNYCTQCHTTCQVIVICSFIRVYGYLFRVAIETKTSKPNNSASTDQPPT